MKRLNPFSLILLFLLPLSHAQQTTNFFISPGSQADQLASGNNSADYPIYQQDEPTLISWKTNWTLVSLLLYQNENSSAIRLLSFVDNPPSSLMFNMSPPVNLTWNDVFFLTLYNDNYATEGGDEYFPSSYFRINASAPTTTTTTTTSKTPTPTPTPSNATETTPSSQVTPAGAATSNSDSGSSGLSSSATVGLGVGLGLGIPLLALAGVALFFYRRRASSSSGGPNSGPGAGGGASQMQYYHQLQRAPPPGVDLANPSPFKLGGYSPSSTPPVEVPNYPLQELPGHRIERL